MGRSRQFSANESNKLLEIIEKYKKEIECKKSDVQTGIIKEDAWQKVLLEFNASNEVCGDIKELKTKFKNLRYTTKNKLTLERKNIYGTGGGPQQVVSFTKEEERCRNLLHSKEAEGVASHFDNDAVEYLNEEYLQMSPECNANEPTESEELPLTPKNVTFKTPVSGPSTLRAPMHESLRVSQKKNKTSWTKLADVKSKWTEERMQADLIHTNKIFQQMDEQHSKEMEILEIRLEKEKLQVEREKLEIEKLKLEINRLSK